MMPKEIIFARFDNLIMKQKNIYPQQDEHIIESEKNISSNNKSNNPIKRKSRTYKKRK